MGTFHVCQIFFWNGFAVCILETENINIVLLTVNVCKIYLSPFELNLNPYLSQFVWCSNSLIRSKVLV